MRAVFASVVGLVVTATIAACGTIVSIEGPGVTETPPGEDDGAARDGGGVPGDDASASGDGAPADGAVDVCTATGTPAIDPTFASRSLAISLVRGAWAPGGGFVVVGRSFCGDGGEAGVELRTLDADGAPSASRPPRCIATGQELVESFAPRTAGGWELGSSLVASPYTAMLRTLDAAGNVVATKTRSGDFHQLALPVGSSLVWAGHRASPAPEGTGFLGVAGGAISTTSGERVVAAGARGADLFAVVLSTADVSNPTVTLRKYLVGAAVSETAAARSAAVAVPAATSAASFDGLGGILVEGAKVTAALPDSGAIAIYEYVEGAGWAPKASVGGLVAPTLLARSCDGSLLLAYASTAGGYRLARFVAGNPNPTSELPLPAGGTPRSLLVDAQGRILVFQVVGGQGSVFRVVP
ncbi:MAG: hypothetical protein JST00_34205 [Deltaproteobacteria bacterium]|nr:hypothetical protein [Deltaproteobacteria bacterium]